MTFLQSLIRTAKRIMIVIVLTILILFSIKAFQHYVLGYPNHTNSPIDAAEWLVARNLPPVLCKKIAPNILFGSQPAEQKAECIFKYAKLTKDPSACELLMPSSYGLSCVGAAENHQLPCGLGKYSVWIGKGETSREVPLSECTRLGKESPTELVECCAVARTAFLEGENDCASLIHNPSVYDSCLYRLAWKEKDESVCNEMQNINAKSACIVQSKALGDDPSICQNCLQPIEKLEDLR